MGKFNKKNFYMKEGKMAKINENFLNLEDDYLFSKILEKTEKYKKENPSKKIISLGIGDVTLPLTKSVIKNMNKAVYELSKKETFKGYGKVQGYKFLIDKIIEYEYQSRGVDLEDDEIFISSGTKGDLAGIIEILGLDNKVGIIDPVYPAYRDTNIMLGRNDILYIEANEENNFIPDIPNEHVDIVYLCCPNNPTGIVLNKEQLKKWVLYAKQNDAIILYDSVYEVFIENENIPHSIYEIEGAKDVAIEFRSYSKMAGFTGVRLSYVVVPKNIKLSTKSDKKVEINNIWRRRQSTKYGAAPYFAQKAAEAIYSTKGQKEIKENIKYYKENAQYIKNELEKIGFKVFGGENSPYIWLKVPKNMSSWEFFDKLLNEASIVGTPGVGFGKCGEGYFRLTAFSSKNDTKEAIKRIVKLFG